MSFNIGDELTLANEVRLNGVDTDDAGLTLEVTNPAGGSAIYTVADFTHVGTGHYSLVIVGDAVGVWRWTWTPSPSYSGTSSGFFLVGGSLYEHESWCSADEALNTPALRSLRDATTDALTEDDPLLRQACTAATEFLYSRTHRRFSGLREVELRPCCTHSFRSFTNWPRSQQWPMVDGDSDPIRDGVSECGCTHMTTIGLPVDVQAVEYVMLDGDLFTDWRLDGRLLVRTDETSWPYCSDVIAPDTEPGTFSVHVVVGNDVPTIARLAARELAAELYLADADPSSCRIPTRINTVQRQGATYTRVDTTTLGKDGMLGLRITDIFLSEFGKRRRRIEMASPDVHTNPRRVGGPV